MSSQSTSVTPFIYDPWGQFKVQIIENSLAYFEKYSKLQKAMMAALIVTAMEQKMVQYFSGKAYDWVWIFYYKLAQLIKRKQYIRNRIINKITDDRKPNTLYDCMLWFLGKLDADSEETIKCFTIDNYDGTTPELLKQNQRGETKKFTYENHTVFFTNETKKIRVDGEDFDRTNDTITLTIYTNNPNDNWLESVFIKQVMEEYRTHIKNKRFQQAVYQNMNSQKGSEWEQVSYQPKELHDKIVLYGNDKDYLLREVNHFIKEKQWYIDNGYQYKLGILLHGEPGCGKTSIIRLISYLTRRNTHYLRLSQIKDENQFNDLLKPKNISLENTVLVLEDIDCQKLVHKREQPKPEVKPIEQQAININLGGDAEKTRDRDQSPLNLDTLLNVLDGILTTSGQIVIMTTNHKEILDPALIRPGRIDVDLELKKCDYSMITQLTQQFYKRDPPTEFEGKLPLNKHSPAFIMNVFRRYRQPKDITTAFEDIINAGSDEEIIA